MTFGPKIIEWFNGKNMINGSPNDHWFKCLDITKPWAKAVNWMDFERASIITCLTFKPAQF